MPARNKKLILGKPSNFSDQLTDQINETLLLGEKLKRILKEVPTYASKSE